MLAPDHSLLLEVLHAFAGLPEAAPLVVARHATQPVEHLTQAQDLARDRAAAAAAAAAAGVAGGTDGRKRRRLEGAAAGDC